MPKPKNRNHHIYDREGVWWLRCTVNGKSHRESLRTTDVLEARDLRDKRFKEIEKAKKGESTVSWKAAVLSWDENECDQVGPNTLKRYRVSLKQAEPFLAHLSIDAIDKKAINVLVEGRKKAGATAATIRRDLTAVSKVLEYAEDQNWREGNPTLAKRKRLKERRDPIILPDAFSIEAVCMASSTRFSSLVRAAWATGCRQAELYTATWRSFNRRTETLEIIGKGNKRRTIKLSAEALPQFVLAREMAQKTGPDDTIFQNEFGEPFAQAASDFCHFRREAEHKAIMEERPFRRFRFHDLRHLFAVEALRSGAMGLYELSKHLGHTSVKTTETHYLAFLTPEQAEEAKKARAA